MDYISCQVPMKSKNLNLQVLRFRSTDEKNDWMIKHKKSMSVLNEPLFVLASDHYDSNISSIVRRGKAKLINQTVEFSTDRIIVGFEEPQTEQTVRSVVGLDDVKSFSPLEDGVTEDWAWIIHLDPTVDPEKKAEEVNKITLVEYAEPDRIHVGFDTTNILITV